jgi:hypothetical protein
VDTEFDQLRDEIDRIANVTEFNGVGLSRGAATNAGGSLGLTSLDVQVGMYNTTDDRIAVTLGDLTVGASGLDLTSNVAVGLGSPASAQAALDRLDVALDSVNTYRSNFGALSNRLESSLRNLETYTESLKAAESQIRDADFAHEAAEMSKQQIMQQAGTAVLGQANQIRAQSTAEQSNAISVRIELQADCYSGIWARGAQERFGSIERGDIAEAMNAAAQIGDDTLARNAGRAVQPHTFTHGTSAQRQRWFVRGHESGDLTICDTFSATQL